MGAPYEILTGPIEIYRAPVGTPFEDLDTLEGAFDPAWKKIGTSGSLNYTRDGVSITHNLKSEDFRADGDLGVRKTFFTEQDQMVKVTIADVSPEQYSLALNGNTIATVAAGLGTVGTKEIGLSVDTSEPQQYALMIRGISSLIPNAYGQYQIPVAVQVGEPEVVYKRGTPAMLALNFKSLVDQNAATPQKRFGSLLVASAAALT